LIRIDRLPELIEKRNVKSIAITDHGNVDGAIKFYKELKKTSAIPLLGCEFYVVDDLNDRTNKLRYHMIAIAKNRHGLSSIMKTLTSANLDGFFYRPRTDWKHVLEGLDDVVVTTACSSGILAHPDWSDLICRFRDKYKDDFYLESILIKDYKEQHALNQMVHLLHQELGIKVVYTNDVHYVDEQDWAAREVVRAISINQKIRPGLIKSENQSDIYLKTYDEMVDSLAAFGLSGEERAMVDVWDEITEKCKFSLEPKSISIPIAYPEAKDDPNKFLEDLCIRSLAGKGLDKNAIAGDRLENELKEIFEQGFSEYFLLVKEVIDWARENGCRVGPGRGSVGGSLVAYLLGITQIDPLQYGLVFERFVSPGRRDLPDIDIDFEDVERKRVLGHLKEKYGLRKVANVSTFSTTKGRGSIRDVGRVFDVPLVEIDKMAKQVLTKLDGEVGAGSTVEDTVASFEEAKDFYAKHPYVIDYAKVIEGLTKTKGMHAAGIVVDTDDLYSGDKCVLTRGKDDELVVNWDKADLEFMGMMKIDALGLKTLNVFTRASEMVERRTGKKIDLNSVELDDKKVFETIKAVDTIGTFQFGSSGMTQYLREFKPKNFTELYQVNALFRPGTLRSGLAREFILFKDGKKRPSYASSGVKEILHETHGIMLFQEQIMFVLNRIGGLSWSTTDKIRKIIGKSEGKEKFEAYRKEFADGAERLGTLSRGDADKLFELMTYFGAYGFNKSHSVEYTVLGYWTIWLKTYFPAEFICASLQRADDKDDITELLSDAERHGMRIVLPNINLSGQTWELEGDNVLRAGLTIIKGISERVADEVIKAREDCGGKFKDFFEFIGSVNRKVVNVGRVKTLLFAKVFSGIMEEEFRKDMLKYIGYYKSLPADKSQLSSVSELKDVDEELDIFNFELSDDYYGFYKEMVKALSEKLDIKKMITITEEENPSHWYVGRFDEIKRGNGSVYGVFRDDSHNTYVSVSRELYGYENKKRMIEDSAGRLALVYGERSKSGGMTISKMYLLEDFRRGDFGSMRMKELLNPDFYDEEMIREQIRNCEKCSARKGCTFPVPFQKGQINKVMIVGEAPGADEDRTGIPFVGKAGQILWGVLGDLGISKTDVHTTNVMKCRPKDNKITEPKIALDCGHQWLKKEIDLIKPRLIFSLGKTALHYFSGDKTSGIMERNSIVEWNERAKAWIVYGIHPAMILYSPENKVLLENAAKEFSRMMSVLL
jgi:DNA polymerase-3 subunit alpha